MIGPSRSSASIRSVRARRVTLVGAAVLPVLVLVLILGVFSDAAAAERQLSLPVVAGGSVALLLLGAGLATTIAKRSVVSVAAAAPGRTAGGRPPVAPRIAPVSAAVAVEPRQRPIRVTPPVAEPRIPSPKFVSTEDVTIEPRIAPAPVAEVPQEIVASEPVTEPALDGVPVPPRRPAARNGVPTIVVRVGPELRTPLHAILGFGEALRQEKAGPLSAEQKACVEEVLASGRRLLRLVNDAADLARLEAGAREFHAEPVDPLALVRDVRDAVRALAVRKRVTVVTEVDPALTEVVVDATALKQVLFDRLSSAVQLAPPHSQVTIRVSPEADTTFRVAVVTRRAGDRGPDFALDTRLVEALGGRVGVERDPTGNTAVFAILPRAI